MVEQHLPELIELNRLLDEAPSALSSRVAHTVEVDGSALPIHVLTLGNPDPALPAIGYYGGVHGLVQLPLAYMATRVFLRGLTREARHWGDFP